MYSTEDGLTWKSVKSDISSHKDITSIVWDGQQYLGIGKFITTFRSTNLEKWQSTNNFVTDIVSSVRHDLKINKIISDGKQHIAIADHGFILVNESFRDNTASSTDWTIVREKEVIDFSHLLFDGKTRYVATGTNNLLGTYFNSGSIWESSNGYDWSKSEVSTAPPFMLWTQLAAGNGTIVAYGYGHNTSGNPTDRRQYFYSTTPGVWEPNKFPAGVTTIFGISWVNQQFYAAVNGGFITSKNGVDWSKVNSSALTMAKITPGGKIIVGLRAPNQHNENGNLLYSSYDGASWKKVNLIMNSHDPIWGSSDTLRDISWNGKQFAAIGSNPTVAVSQDGLNWSVKETANRYQNLAWNGRLYMASAFGDGSDYGKMFYSYDGLNYSMSTQVTNHSMNTEVIWDGEKFIVAGDDGTILIGKPSK